MAAARVVDRGKHITLQWVPGHAGLERNEMADQLANKAAASENQSDVPLDFSGARAAIRAQTKMWTNQRESTHPCLAPTPNHDEVDRWGQATLSQLRVGQSTLARATLHRIGLAEDPNCLKCGEIDTVTHMLAECPADSAEKSRLWGGRPPTLEYILQDPGEKILDYLRRVGRAD